MVQKKTDKYKTPSDIILEAIRAMKVYNLSVWQAILEFNMNYRALSFKCDYQLWNMTINPKYGINCQIFTISFNIK